MEALRLYYKQLQRIEKTRSTKLSSWKQNDNLLKILTLTADSLPLSVCQQLENYALRPDDSDFEDRIEIRTRESLTSYKRALLEYAQTYPTVDIDDVIRDLSFQ